MEILEVALGSGGAREPLDHLAVNLVIPLQHTLDEERRHLVDDLVLASIVASLARARHARAQKEILLAPDVGRG